MNGEATWAVRVAAAVAAPIVAALSWVWFSARRAQQDAAEAKQGAAAQGVALGDLSRRVTELREEQRDGFRRVHERLDKILGA